MKKAILLLILVVTNLVFFSCKNDKVPKSIVMQKIEKNIYDNAAGFGIDIKYQPGLLDTEIVVMQNQTYNYIMSLFPNGNVEHVLNFLMESKEEAKANNNIKDYHLYNYTSRKLYKVRDNDSFKVNYSVYKYSYTIRNILDSTKRMPVTNFYFFNEVDSFIGMCDEAKMKEYKYNNIDNPISPYENFLFDYFTSFNLDSK